MAAYFLHSISTFEAGEDCTMRSFIACTVQQVFFWVVESRIRWAGI